MTITRYFLGSGIAGATCIVVVRFSRASKRYERQGILVEEEAFKKGKSEVGVGKHKSISTLSDKSR